MAHTREDEVLLRLTLKNEKATAIYLKMLIYHIQVGVLHKFISVAG